MDRQQNIYGRKWGRGMRPWLLIPKYICVALILGGLGAVVTVLAGGGSCRKVNDGKSGYLSQSAGPLYFGLGFAPKVDAIEVRWPSGRSQRLDGPIGVNRGLVVREP